MTENNKDEVLDEVKYIKEKGTIKWSMRNDEFETYAVCSRCEYRHSSYWRAPKVSVCEVAIHREKAMSYDFVNGLRVVQASEKILCSRLNPEGRCTDFKLKHEIAEKERLEKECGNEKG